MRIESERKLLPEVRGQEAVSDDVAAAFGLAFAQAMTSTAVSSINGDSHPRDEHTNGDAAGSAITGIGETTSAAANGGPDADATAEAIPTASTSEPSSATAGPTTPAPNAPTSLSVAPAITAISEQSLVMPVPVEIAALRNAVSLPVALDGDSTATASLTTPLPETRLASLALSPQGATDAAVGAATPSIIDPALPTPDVVATETTVAIEGDNAITATPTLQHPNTKARELHSLGAASPAAVMPESAPTLSTAAPAAPTAVTTAPTSPTAPLMPSPAHQLVAIVAPLRVRADGTTRLTLGLRPEHLGAVDVEVRIENGVVHLHVRAEQPATVELLRDSIDDLRGQLSQRGVAAGDVSVGGRSSQADGDGTRNARHEVPASEPDHTGPTLAPVTDPDALVDVRM